MKSYKDKYKKIVEYNKIKGNFMDRIRKKYSELNIFNIEFGKNFIRCFYKESERGKYFYIYPTSLNVKYDERVY